MSEHLCEREFAEALVVPGSAAAEHLRGCERCRAEAGRVLGAMSAFRESVNAAAEADPYRWIRQQAAVAERTASARRRAGLGWARAALAALLVAAALFWMAAPKPHPAVARNSVSDEQLLASVDSDLQRDVPLALAPAGLIAEERSRILAAAPSADSPMNK